MVQGLNPKYEYEASPEDSIFFHFGGNVSIREGVIKAGQSIMKHVHDYSHLSILGKGKATLFVEGEPPQTLNAEHKPIIILVKANKEHSVYAETDIIWMCVQSMDDLNDISAVKIGG